MTRFRVFIAVCALIGAVVGAVLGYVLSPHPHRYKATANVALLPAADLTTVEASNFWEVLTRGQVSRTAAVVFDDPRWLTSAANTAKVPLDELSLDAAALPETTMLSVTVVANTAGAAEVALNDVLTTAAPEVASLTAPYVVKVVWPPKGSAVPVPLPGHLQVAAAGALGGFLVGGGLGWLVMRRRGAGTPGEELAGDIVDDEARHRS